MPVPDNFPLSPFEELSPDGRWIPDSDNQEAYRLIPPLVDKIRHEVKNWRDNKYEGATNTSKALLNYWFEQEHLMYDSEGIAYNFQYYFAQREAVETVIYLYEIAGVRNKHDLLQFASYELTEKFFDESWIRFVIKMGTGSGKTKVISLILVWSYFNKLYEENSELSRNFLIITPNIIVLDRILSDFDGLDIFFKDPLLPENGDYEHNWREDFQLNVHVQDNVHLTSKTGNIFITNVHRIYDSNHKEPSYDDEDTSNYFLGEKAIDEKESHVDLGDIVRNNLDEMFILNDEAHHIHDKKLKWYEAIQDVHNNLVQKGKALSMQVDFTATPKDKNGNIFPQTIVDYPLVEAITQNIIKQPILPDKASRNNMKEVNSSKIEERYEDHLHVGYLEWKKSYEENEKIGKKAVMFVMVEDTKKCDDVGRYLENRYPEFRNAVLVIHTKADGNLSESTSKKNQDELKLLRDASNNIDNWDSPYKVIVSVLVLKEGWDVKNVTTIVGLRTFTSKAKILPEQTLGRGLRKMYSIDTKEKLSVIGTDAFMEFVESIKKEGVQLEEGKMGGSGPSSQGMVIEVDDNKENLDELDIKIPLLSSMFYKRYDLLESIDVSKLNHEKIILRTEDEFTNKKITFKHVITDETDHIIQLEGKENIDYRNVIKFFTESIIAESNLSSGSNTIYKKLKEFIKYYLFDKEVSLEDKLVIKNLSLNENTKTIIEIFVDEINKIITQIEPHPIIKDTIHVKDMNPFITRQQGYLIPHKSVFNKIVGDSDFELEFAELLDSYDDIISFAKNYLSITFYVDYQNINHEVKKYYPDFLVKTSENRIYVIETKGLADLNVPLKYERLVNWCEQVNQQQECTYIPLYVEQNKYEKYRPSNFEELVNLFKNEGDKLLNNI